LTKGIAPLSRTRIDDSKTQAMTDSWTTMPVTDVKPDNRTRLANGLEVLASMIEPNFLGRDAMVAFIETCPIGGPRPRSRHRSRWRSTRRAEGDFTCR